MVKDLGILKEGKIYHEHFPFKNEGTDTLYINQVKTSCGCTIAKFPSYSIAPNGVDTIFVDFDTKDKHGDFEKVIHVFSNAHNKLVDLKITGHIE